MADIFRSPRSSDVDDPPAPPAPRLPPPFHRRGVPAGVAALLLLALGVIGLRYWLLVRDFHATDRAVVQARVATVSPPRPGVVGAVTVAEGQRVSAGDVLVRLDGDAEVRAPASGRVTQVSVREGAHVDAGHALMSVVTDEVWVLASFTEAAAADIRAGQPARVRIGAYGDREFQGRVAAVEAEPGTRLTLVPPESATMQDPRVGRRVPVRILLEELPDPGHPLDPGMTAVATVAVR